MPKPRNALAAALMVIVAVPDMAIQDGVTAPMKGACHKEHTAEGKNISFSANKPQEDPLNTHIPGL